MTVKEMKAPMIRYAHRAYSPEEMLERSRAFYQSVAGRRSIREFSSHPIPIGVLENVISAAGTAPSGANKQPWTFCVVTAPRIKKAIREAAEKEEFENYHGRMSEEWLDDLKKFGTDHIKEHIEVAPALIVVFKRSYEQDEEGVKEKNYYVNESVGIAVGLLLTAIHQAGLVSLTHTPSPMNFLADILQRPANERAFLLIPVGHPAEDATVPDIERKALNCIMERYD